MKRISAALSVVLGAACIFGLTLGGDPPPDRVSDIDRVQKYFASFPDGMFQEMPVVHLTPQEQAEIGTVEMESVFFRPLVVLGDYYGSEIPERWRAVPVISMAEIGSLTSSPAAGVFFGMPWHLIPPGAAYQPAKKPPSLRCTSDAKDCAATGMAWCKKKGGLQKLLYVVPKADDKVPEGLCQVQCIDGQMGQAKPCGDDSIAGGGCPCQDDPCAWGSQSCCAGVPPPWCQ